MLRPAPTTTLFPYTTLFRSTPGNQRVPGRQALAPRHVRADRALRERSEEHTSELQSRFDLVCRLLLEKKNHHEHRSGCAHAADERSRQMNSFWLVRIRLARW